MERKTLAESMAEQIREAILAGVWSDGEALPTEPELAERFEVSRAVVRDATRIVTAWGLVEPRQGKGVFVNGDARRGFSDALLLALRRTGGTALDVEQVDFLLLVEAAAMAAARAGEVDFDSVYKLVDAYETALLEQSRNIPEVAGFTVQTGEAFQALIESVYEASGNRLLAILGPSVARIRAPRHFEDDPADDPVEESRKEAALMRRMIDSIAAGDADEAREFFTLHLALHDRIAPTLAATPVGEVPGIPSSLRDLMDERPE